MRSGHIVATASFGFVLGRFRIFFFVTRLFAFGGYASACTTFAARIWSDSPPGLRTMGLATDCLSRCAIDCHMARLRAGRRLSLRLYKLARAFPYSTASGSSVVLLPCSRASAALTNIHGLTIRLSRTRFVTSNACLRYASRHSPPLRVSA